jgi:hypothetical protein
MGFFLFSAHCTNSHASTKFSAIARALMKPDCMLQMGSVSAADSKDFCQQLRQAMNQRDGLKCLISTGVSVSRLPVVFPKPSPVWGTCFVRTAFGGRRFPIAPPKQNFGNFKLERDSIKFI